MPENGNNQNINNQNDTPIPNNPQIRRVYLRAPQTPQSTDDPTLKNKITNILSTLDDVDNKLLILENTINDTNKNVNNLKDNILQMSNIFENFNYNLNSITRNIMLKFKNFQTTLESADTLLVSTFTNLIDYNSQLVSVFDNIKNFQTTLESADTLLVSTFTNLIDYNSQLVSVFDNIKNFHNLINDYEISLNNIVSNLNSAMSSLVNNIEQQSQNFSQSFENTIAENITQYQNILSFSNEILQKLNTIQTTIVENLSQMKEYSLFFQDSISTFANSISNGNINKELPIESSSSFESIIQLLTDIKELLKLPNQYLEFKLKTEKEQQSKIFEKISTLPKETTAKTAVGSGLQGAAIGQGLGKTLFTKYLPALASGFIWLEDIVNSLNQDIPVVQKVLQSLFGSVDERGRGMNALMEAQKWGLLGFTIGGPIGALIGQGIGQALGQIGQEGLMDIGNAIKEIFTGIEVSEDVIGKYLEEIKKDPRYQKLTETEQKMLQERMQQQSKRPIVYQIRKFGSSIAEEVKNWGRRFQNLVSNDLYYTQEELEKELFELKVEFPELSEEELYKKQLENLRKKKTFAGMFDSIWENIKSISTKIGHGLVTFFRMGIPTEKEIQQKIDELLQEFPDLSDEELRSMQIDEINQERPFYTKTRNLFDKQLAGLKNIGNSITTFFFGNKITDEMINERVAQLKSEFPDLSDRELQAIQIQELNKEQTPKFGVMLENLLQKSLDGLKNIGLNIKAFFTRNKITDEMINERVSQLKSEFPDLTNQELEVIQLRQLSIEYQFPIKEKITNLFDKQINGLKNIGNSIKSFFLGNKITDEMVNERVAQLKSKFPDLSDRELQAMQIQELNKEQTPKFGVMLENLLQKSLEGLKNIGNSIKSFFFQNTLDSNTINNKINDLKEEFPNLSDQELKNMQIADLESNITIRQKLNSMFDKQINGLKNIGNSIKSFFTNNMFNKNIESEINSLNDSLDTDTKSIELKLQELNKKIFDSFKSVISSISGFFKNVGNKIADFFNIGKKNIESEINNISPTINDQLLLPELIVAPEDLYSTQLQSQKMLNNIIIKTPEPDTKLTEAQLEYLKQQNKTMELIYNVLKDNYDLSQEQLDKLINKDNYNINQDINTTVIPDNSINNIQLPSVANEQLP